MRGSSRSHASFGLRSMNPWVPAALIAAVAGICRRGGPCSGSRDPVQADAGVGDLRLVIPEHVVETLGERLDLGREQAPDPQGAERMEERGLLLEGRHPCLRMVAQAPRIRAHTPKSRTNAAHRTDPPRLREHARSTRTAPSTHTRDPRRGRAARL